MVVLADLAGRTLFAPIEIPCGIVTAVVGAPFFLYLLYRTRKT
jgi:iron complex transport system permease protein